MVKSLKQSNAEYVRNPAKLVKQIEETFGVSAAASAGVVMAAPGAGDGWQGNPTVCSIGQYRVSPVELSGKVVIITLPMHDGYRAKLNGNGSSIKLFQYLFTEEFIE